VAVGGALGSMARFGLVNIVYRVVPSGFPFGTALVNVIGCLVFGVIAALMDERGMMGGEGRAFLLVGVLGGFTTFSSFEYDTFVLLRDGLMLRASMNVAGQVLIGLAALWAGYSSVQLF
jgi:CrcB protein